MTDSIRNIGSARARRTTREVQRALVAVALLGALSGCLDLNVTDPNGLGIETVFTNAANTEAALIGSWKAYTEVARSTCPSLPFGVWGDEITTTSVTYIDYSAEPRIPINNRDNVNCSTRGAYWTPFESMAGAREGFQGIKTNGLKFGAITAATPDGADTPSRLIFAKFLIAINTLRHGLYFDQAFLSDTATPPGEKGNTFTPFPQVLAAARAQLRNVIADAQATANFTWPTGACLQISSCGWRPRQFSYLMDLKLQPITFAVFYRKLSAKKDLRASRKPVRMTRYSVQFECTRLGNLEDK